MENFKGKKCEVCGEVKPISQFSKSYRNRCKQCVAEAARQRRAGAEREITYFPDPRYELTKIALQGIMTHASIEGMHTRQIAEMAVDIADETLRALNIENVNFEKAE